MNRLSIQWLSCLLAAAILVPSTSFACGGCFSPPGQQNNQLVLQNAERVLFHQDPKTGKSLVWVEVRYTGLAQDFGWVLPLPKVPKVSVDSSWVFDQLDGRHAPRFSTDIDPDDENCRNWATYCFGATSSQAGGGNGFSADAAASAPGGGRGEAADDGVQVLEKSQAGPYDYEILASKDAKALLDWLNKNGYKAPEVALPIIESHLKKNDVFVAVKLQNNAGVNEIKPIVLEMDETESCVPLRLTSIAATDNMSVVATLAGPGRAVPKNHMHVQLNPMKLNWFGNGSNYEQVMAAAIDEAAGHAFVTEYADAGAETELIGKAARMDAKPFDLVTDAGGLAQALLASKLIITDDSVNILEKHTGLAKQAGMEPLQYFSLLRNCGNNRSGFCANQLGSPSTLPVDGPKVGAALNKEFIEPIHTVSDRLKGAPRVTRLVMRISPEEMDRDPIFGFNPELPNVSNEYTATFKRVCSRGWYPYDHTRLTIKGFGSWVFKGTVPNDFNGSGEIGNNAIDERFIESPMALSIELLDEQGAPKPISKKQVQLVDTAIQGATLGKPSLPDGIVIDPADDRWTPPKDEEKRTFVEKRDDSMCTVVHVSKPWQTNAEAAHSVTDQGGGCTASLRAGHSNLSDFAILLVMILCVGVVTRRRAMDQ